MKKPRAAAIATFRHGPSGLEVAIGLRRGEPEKGEWGYPGGHVEDGESPRDGAARELEEEAGVRVDPTSLEYIITQSNTHEVFIFGVEVDEKTQLTSGSDMADMRWISVDQLPKLAFNGNRYVIKAMRKMKLDETTPVQIENMAPEITRLIAEYALADRSTPDTLTGADTEPSWKCLKCQNFNEQGQPACDICGEKRILGLRNPMAEDIEFIADYITEDPDILIEYRCPGCGDPDAYAGINKLECPNYACDKFSQKRADELDRKPPAHQIIQPNTPGARADFCMNCGLSPDKCGCDPSLRHWP